MLLAHKLAMISEWITADMVEAMEFSELADQYKVYGVPLIVVNEVIQVEGAIPEDMFVDEIMTLLDEKKMAKLRSHPERR